MSKKGFTLWEVLATIVLLAVIATILVPIIVTEMEEVRIKAYRAGLQNIFNATRYYLDRNGFKEMPKEGINVTEDFIEMDAKDYIDGRIFENKDKQWALDNVTNSRYCGKGILTNIKVVKGDCYLLDDTPPHDVKIMINKITTNSITVVGIAQDEESPILYYQFRINGGKWSDNNIQSYYTFTNLNSNTEYQLEVKVTNQNHLSTESQPIKATTAFMGIPTFKVEPSGWQQQKKVMITFPSRQENIQYSYYINNGEENIINDNTITFDVVQNVFVYAKVTDGYNEVITPLQITEIDEHPPHCTITVDNLTEWSNSKVLKIQGFDEESGVASILAPNTSTPIESDTVNRLITKNGYYEAKVTDKVGRTATCGIDIEYIDASTPASPTVKMYKDEQRTITYTPGEWSNRIIYIDVSYTGISLSGIDRYEYSYDKTNWQTITRNTMIINTEGSVDISFRLWDKAGNQSAIIGPYTIKIDTIPPKAPQVRYTVNGNTYIPGNWTNRPVVANLSYTEPDTSGIHHYEYSTNGGTWYSLSGNSMSINTQGSTRILFRAVDNATNIGASTTSSGFDTIKVDTVAPSTVSVSFRKGSTNGSIYTPDTWSTQKVYAILSYDRSDTSGIAYYEYSSNGNTWYRMNGNSLYIDQEGVTNWYFRAVDNAGNRGTSTNRYIVKIDTVAPSAPSVSLKRGSSTGSSYYENEWSNQLVYAVLGYNKSDTSGIDHYEYSSNGSNWYKMSGNTMSINTQGTTTLYFRVVDVAGNNGSRTSSYTIKVDTVAPSEPAITLKKGSSSGASYSSGTWTNGNVYIGFSYSRSDTSGIHHYEYSTNGSSWTKISGSSMTWSNEGSTTLYFRAVDNAGNNGSKTSSYSIKIDKTAPNIPTVTMRKGSNNGVTYTSNTWSNQNIYISLSSSDKNNASGIHHYEYSTNGSSWSKWSNGDYWNREGTNTLYFRAIDIAGNPSSKTTAYTIKIDKVSPSAPSVTMKIGSNNGPSYSSGTWTPKDVYVKLSYSRSDTSGIDHYEYSVDGGKWTSMGTNGTEYRANSPRDIRISFRAVDKAGNIGSTTSTYNIKVAYYLADKAVGMGHYVYFDGKYWNILSRSGTGASGRVTLVSNSCVGSLTYYPKSTTESAVARFADSYAARYRSNSYVQSARYPYTSDVYNISRATNSSCPYWLHQASPNAFSNYAQGRNYYSIGPTSPKYFTAGARVILELKAGVYVTKGTGAGTSAAFNIAY